MILRKPYAILIKYFRLIHIVMFVFFGYFVFVFRKIYLFFSEYIKTSGFTYYENMVKNFVPIIIFFMIVILLALSIGIFFLMNKKQKPVLFYKILIGYCTIILGAMIYFYSFFTSLDDTVYEPLRVVVNRDIILGIYIVNFFFVAFTFIRGFGFDIKKFSFDRDKKELNLEESDSEEYELNVNIEKEDITTYLNRQKRELTYYIKQNSTFFTIVGVIIVISLSLYFYYDIFVINKIYHEGDDISIASKVYKVNSSTITTRDKYGQEMNKDADFLVINLSVINYNETGSINQLDIRAHIDDKYYYPQSSICDLFSDIGTCYVDQELKKDISNNYIFIYRIPKNHNKVYLEILKDKQNDLYSKVLLSYKNYVTETIELNMNDSFKLGDNEYKIVDYKLYPKTSYQYEECNGNDCSKFIKNVIPKLNEIVLSIEVENLDKLTDDLLNSAFGMEYDNVKISGKDFERIAKHDNIIYYSVPDKIKSLDSFKIIITTRTKTYNVKLEGGSSE